MCSYIRCSGYVRRIHYRKKIQIRHGRRIQKINPRQSMVLHRIYRNIGLDSYFRILYGHIGLDARISFQAACNNLTGKTAAEFKAEQNAFIQNDFRPLLWIYIFSLSTISSYLRVYRKESKNVQHIDAYIVHYSHRFCIRSLTLPEANEGLKFFLHPDFSKITPQVIVRAMGQAFFSLSLGMGILITYSSYFNNKTHLIKTASTVAILDTTVAILAGVIIFPAVFSYGVDPVAGPDLVFVTLPNVFNQMPVSALWSALFFLLLTVAALTSTVSLFEVAVAFLSTTCICQGKRQPGQ